MIVTSIFLAVMAVFAGVAEAAFYCEPKYFIPIVIFGGKPVTETFLSGKFDEVAKGPNSSTRQVIFGDADVKGVFLDTKQVAKGTKAVLVRTQTVGNLVHCDKARSGYKVFGTRDGKKCVRIVLPFVKTYCTKNRASAVKRIVGGPGDVRSLTALDISKGGSAVTSTIKADVKKNLTIESKLKAQLEIEIEKCRKIAFWVQRRKCFLLAEKKSKAVSDVVLTGKGDNLDAKVVQTAVANKKEAKTSTTIKFSSKSGGKASGKSG